MTLRRLLADRSGAGAAEFALVLPLLLLLLLGMIDAGRFLWAVNKAEKATQMGARMAVVTDPVATGITGYNFVGTTWGGTTLTQGDIIPAGGFDVQCTSTACTCVSCPGGMTVALATGTPSPFDRIVTRVRNFFPEVTAQNVRVRYSGSGLGFAGNPSGSDISPLVTVELSGVQFRPITLLLLATINMPPFRTTLTAEDLAGSASN